MFCGQDNPLRWFFLVKINFRWSIDESLVLIVFPKMALLSKYSDIGNSLLAPVEGFDSIREIYWRYYDEKWVMELINDKNKGF